MPTYEFSCENHGRTEEFFSMGNAPASVPCPDCGADSRRVFSSPMISAVDERRMGLIDSTKATADAPQVLSSVPSGGRINSRPTPMAPPDPRLKKLPRP
ncbi:MAG: zinc ribbon domain-containing protein [Actinomycetota bacterium]